MKASKGLLGMCYENWQNAIMIYPHVKFNYIAILNNCEEG